jgi:spore maturation protein CgeB
MSGYDLVVFGLSLSSSWGNGHATTYRGLLKAYAAKGFRILFLEREQPWYAANRDLLAPDYCKLTFYRNLNDLAHFRDDVANARAVMVGSYTPDGVAVCNFVQIHARGVTAFYDIDTPVTLAALERNDCAYLSPKLISGFDLYLSFTGGPTLACIENDFGVKAARALYCAADPELYHPLATQPQFDLGYIGTYAEDRQPVIERLLIEPARRAPDLRFVVAGPQYPGSIDWPANVSRFDHIAPNDHSTFYNGCRFTLNATRRDMVRAGYSPSVRLFEAAACGAPIISDAWDGLESLFEPGTEIVVARDSADVLRALREMPEPARKNLAKRAREKVLGAHTAAHRADELARYIAQAARAAAPA